MQFMDFSIAYPESPCEMPGFDPDEDMLVIALPDALLDRSTPQLSQHHNEAANRIELSLSVMPNAPPLLIHLPGLSKLPSDAVVLLSLSDSKTLTPPPVPHTAPAAITVGALKGEGLYPPASASGDRSPSEPVRHCFAPCHDWRRDGPPPERFFDLSHPDSRISIKLPPTTQGPVHAIRFIETTETAGSSDTHSSIVLVQSPPGSPPLSPGAITAKFATSLGAPDFRAIAWIWLGNEGYFTDLESGARHEFGEINHNPSLALTGPIAGSVEIRR